MIFNLIPSKPQINPLLKINRHGFCLKIVNIGAVNGVGGAFVYRVRLGDDVVVAEQKDGQEPQNGHIYLKRDKVL